MKCLFCNHHDTQVLETRLNDDQSIIKRRRKCNACDKRFNTLERVDIQMPIIIKANGTRQEYMEEKIRSSIMLALRKRPITPEVIDNAIESISQNILTSGEREISSHLIGDMVMKQLALLDKVAYIRFASVYRCFKDITDFNDIIEQVDDK